MRYFFLTPWKIQTKSIFADAIHEFMGRAHHFVPCIHIFASSTLNQQDSTDFFTKEIKKLSNENSLILCLDENGKNQNSAQFASLLQRAESISEKNIIFCIGGAYGLPMELKNLNKIMLISLSLLTFPHELAFAVLLEQIYRARCIISNHPYHHGQISALAKHTSKLFNC